MVSTRMFVRVEDTSAIGDGHVGTNVSVQELNVTVETQLCPVLSTVLTSTAVVMNHAVSVNKLIDMEEQSMM